MESRYELGPDHIGHASTYAESTDTEGRSAIRVRLEVVPATSPLLPGEAVTTRGWSAFRYTAYAYRRP